MPLFKMGAGSRIAIPVEFLGTLFTFWELEPTP